MGVEAGVRRAWRVLLTAAVICTLLFGFWKQVKRAPFWTREIRPAGSDAGDLARRLRPSLLGERPDLDPLRPVAGYVTDRQDAPGSRPASEYFHDCQYGVAPALLERPPMRADRFLLDFTTVDALEEYCRIHGLRVLERRGSLAVAVHERARAK